MRIPLLVLATVLTVAGCAGGASTASSGAASTPAPARGPMNVITTQEIAAAPADFLTAWDLVMNLRPSMMRTRGQGTSTGGGAIDVVAFLGEMRMGAVSNLTSIPRGQILEIRYWTPTEATQRWGTGYASGAIQVIQRK
jgi:hypothetical protein